MSTVSCGEQKAKLHLLNNINSFTKDDTVSLLSVLNEDKLKEILQSIILTSNPNQLNRLYIKSRRFTHLFDNEICKNILSFLPTKNLCYTRSICKDFKKIIDNKLKPFANGIIHIKNNPRTETQNNTNFNFRNDSTGNHIYISPQMIESYFLNKHSYIFKQCKVIRYHINVRYSMQCLQLLWNTFPNLSHLYLDSYEPSCSTNNSDVIKIVRNFRENGFKSIHIGLINNYDSNGRGKHAVLFRNLLNVQKLRKNLFSLHLMNKKSVNPWKSDNTLVVINEEKWPNFKKLQCLTLTDMIFEGNTFNLLLNNCTQLKVLRLYNVIWNGYLKLPYGVKYVLLSKNSVNCKIQFSNWCKIDYLIIRTECNEKFKKFLEIHGKQIGKKVLNVGLSHYEYVRQWNENIGFQRNNIKLVIDLDNMKNLERNNVCCDNIQFANENDVLKKALCKECVDIIKYGFIQQ